MNLQLSLNLLSPFFILIYSLRSIVLLFYFSHESVVFGYFLLYLFILLLWIVVTGAYAFFSFNHIMLCIVILCIYCGNLIRFLYWASFIIIALYQIQREWQFRVISNPIGWSLLWWPYVDSYKRIFMRNFFSTVKHLRFVLFFFLRSQAVTENWTDLLIPCSIVSIFDILAGLLCFSELLLWCG